MADQLGDPGLVGYVLWHKTSHHWAYGELREAVVMGLRAAELLRRAGELWGLADILAFLGHGLSQMGRLDEAASITEELESVASRLGHAGALFIISEDQQHRELLNGNLDAQQAVAEKEIDLCRNAGLPWVSISYSMIGLNHFWRGHWQHAIRTCEQAAGLEPPGFIGGADWGPLFLVSAYSDERKGALAMLRQKRGALSLLMQGVRAIRAIDREQLRLVRAFRSLHGFAGHRVSLLTTLRLQRGGLPSPGEPATYGSTVMLAAVVEGLAILGEGRRTSELYPQVLDFMEKGVKIIHPHMRLVETLAGIAAAAGRQWQKAEEHYQRALNYADELPHRIEQPEVRRWYARMLLDRDAPGDRETARRLLTEAVAMYRKIGMPKHVEMAEALLAQC
jgi:tetratricopeptide (TPR) repeat protein